MKNAPYRRCAQRLKALADGERLKIVECLFDGPKSVGAIATLVEDELVNVSHHLGVLRNAGLVDASKQGRFVIYSLAATVNQPAPSGESRRLELGCCRVELPLHMSDSAD